MRVGFTNGCFDVLHDGHMHFLDRCKAQCDYLIVALNTDRDVRRLKGEGRPFQTLEQRIQGLQALCSATVDAVVPFEGDDHLRLLICALNPVVLFKGSDYELPQIIGGEEVIQAGGRVVIIPRLPLISTTENAQREQDTPARRLS